MDGLQKHCTGMKDLREFQQFHRMSVDVAWKPRPVHSCRVSFASELPHKHSLANSHVQNHLWKVSWHRVQPKMMSNLGKNISDSASCSSSTYKFRWRVYNCWNSNNWAQCQNPWNIPFWLLPQLSQALCPTCLSRSSVASFCKAESLKPVMCQGHDILLSFTNAFNWWKMLKAFQQGSMTPVLGENALDGMPATASTHFFRWIITVPTLWASGQFRASQYGKLKTPSCCHCLSFYVFQNEKRPKV